MTLTWYSYQVDFTKVATECHVVGRVFRLQLYDLTNVNMTNRAKHFERLMKAHGITPSGGLAGGGSVSASRGSNKKRKANSATPSKTPTPTRSKNSSKAKVKADADKGHETENGEDMKEDVAQSVEEGMADENLGEVKEEFFEESFGMVKDENEDEDEA